MGIIDKINLYPEFVRLEEDWALWRGRTKTIMKIILFVLVALVMGWPVLQLINDNVIRTHSIDVSGWTSMQLEDKLAQLEVKMAQLGDKLVSDPHCACTSSQARLGQIADISFVQDNFVTYASKGNEWLRKAEDPSWIPYNNMIKSGDSYKYLKKSVPQFVSLMKSSINVVDLLRGETLARPFISEAYIRKRQLDNMSTEMEYQFKKSAKTESSILMKSILTYETIAKPASLPWVPDGIEPAIQHYTTEIDDEDSELIDIVGLKNAECTHNWPSIAEVKKKEKEVDLPSDLKWMKEDGTGDAVYLFACSFFDGILAYDESNMYKIMTDLLGDYNEDFTKMATKEMPFQTKASYSTVYNSSLEAFVTNVTLKIDPDLHLQSCSPQTCVYVEYGKRSYAEKAELVMAVFAGVPAIVATVMIFIGAGINFIFKAQPMEDTDDDTELGETFLDQNEDN